MGIAGTAARLLASLDLDTKPFEAGARRAGAAMDKMGSRAYRIGARMGTGFKTAARNIGAIGVAAGTVAVAALTKSVQAASNLEQSMGAVDSVFGKSAGVIEDWSKRAANAAGLSQRQVSEMAAVTGAQLQGMGFKVKESAELSIDLQKRAADLAATFGGTTEEAVQSMSSLLRGERDPIERYGVSIKQADINARVLAKGLDTSTTEAKKNAEAIAALELLMEQTAKTSGQFERETDSLAGQQQKLRANLENTGAIIGRVLLPQLSKLTGRFNEALVKHQPDIERMAGKLPAVFDKLLSVAERLPWSQIADSFKLMGQGAEAALDLFTKMPPWVQTAVLTGWGLNKLTGGALGGIIGELGKGLIKGVLGINAGVVNVNGGTVRGGGGAPATGAAGAASAAKSGMSAASKMFLVGEAIGLVLAVNEVRDKVSGDLQAQSKDIHTTLTDSLAGASNEDLKIKLDAINTGIAKLEADPLAVALVTGPALDELKAMRAEVVAELDSQTTHSLDILQANRELTGRMVAFGEKIKVPKGRPPDAQDSERNTAAVQEVARKLDGVQTAVENNKSTIDWSEFPTTMKWKPAAVIQIEDKRGEEFDRTVAENTKSTVDWMSEADRKALALRRASERQTTRIEAMKSQMASDLSGVRSTTRSAMDSSASRIVAAIYANRPSLTVNVTTNTVVRTMQESGVYSASHVGAYNKASTLL